MIDGREHLHHDDVPSTLAILADLLDHRSTLPDGYELTEHRAWVDWDALRRSWLSSTEVAAIHIARGCAIAERQGRLPLSVARAVREAVEELTGSRAITPPPAPPPLPASTAQASRPMASPSRSAWTRITPTNQAMLT